MLTNGWVGVCLLAMATLGNPLTSQAQESASKRFVKSDTVELGSIVKEWRTKHPSTPIYACSCHKSICERRPYWPFRPFQEFQFLPALGSANANNAISQGFKCFDIDTGAAPESETK